MGVGSEPVQRAPAPGLRAVRADPAGADGRAAGSRVDVRHRHAGARPDAPTIVLLHALGCTGLLTWFPAIEPLSRRFRVVTLDLRWHGQGIHDGDFSLVDCADDVGALIDVLELEEVLVAGYSMGSIVAQRVWRQHRARIRGLVLCATTDRFQMNLGERFFFTSMGAAMLGPAHRLALADRRTRLPRRRRRPWTSSRATSRSGRSPSCAPPRRGRSPRRSPRSAGTTPGPGWARSTSPPPSWSTGTTT